jgi:pyruvate formate-lyase activating enzyme-like uncharacterized protein
METISDPIVRPRKRTISKLTQCRRDLRKAVKLLREAKGAIDDELNSAGIDEVRQHPILRAHDRISDRIEKFLNS